MESPIFLTSNTGVNNLQIKQRDRILFEKTLNPYLSLILFEKYTNNERSKEIHVHIDSEENKNIFSHIEIKPVDELKEALQAFPRYTQTTNWLGNSTPIALLSR